MGQTLEIGYIAEGANAPDFCLRDQCGKEHRLADYAGKWVVLYFYPEDDTPLCTTQACQFKDLHASFTGLGAVVLGVSPDPVQSHAAFAAKFGLPFPLLVDEPDRKGEPKVSRKYGAWGDKNMYGNIVRSMLRTTYLIDPDGKVAKVWKRVKTPGHGEAVLDAVRMMAAD